MLCKRLDLFGGELVAIDGSKFHAVNSKNRNFSEGKLKRLLEEIDAKIDAYLTRLDRQDAADATVRTPTREELQEILRRYRERKQAYEGYDEKHKLIVAHAVTNAVTDRDQLASMAEAATATVGAETLTVVADMGYYHGAEVKQCEAQGIVAYVAKPNTSANTKLGLFGKERFRYDATADVLAYNMKRVINILGVTSLVRALV